MLQAAGNDGEDDNYNGDNDEFADGDGVLQVSHDDDDDDDDENAGGGGMLQASQKKTLVHTTRKQQSSHHCHIFAPLWLSDI